MQIYRDWVERKSQVAFWPNHQNNVVQLQSVLYFCKFFLIFLEWEKYTHQKKKKYDK